MPRHLHGPEHALRMRLEDREAAIARREPGNALWRPVRVYRMALGGRTRRVDEAQRDERLRRLRLRSIAKLREALAVRGRHRDAAARHAGEEQARRAFHGEQHEARLELLGAIAHEVRPVLGTWNQLLQVA